MPSTNPWRINKDLLIYKSFYFFYFGALGAINPYLPVYLRQIGLSAFAVGLLVGIRPIVQLASAPFWTVVADKFRKRKSILVMSIMAWLIMTIALVFVEPTEEICEFTAKDNSHSVFVNYTKHKTGFFKRSTDKPEAISARHERVPSVKRRGTHIMSPSVHRRIFNMNFLENKDSHLEEMDFKSPLRRKHDGKGIHATAIKPGQIKLTLNNDKAFRKGHGKVDKRNARATPALTEQQGHRHLENMLSKMGKMPNTLQSNPRPKNLSVEQNVSSSSNIFSSSGDSRTSTEGSQEGHQVFDPFNMNGKSNSAASGFKPKNLSVEQNVSSSSNIFSSSGDSPTSTEGSQEGHQVFDPFNMNGKSNSAAGAAYAKFFATTHNQTSFKSTDAHYYNMNRAESQHTKSVNNTASITTSMVKNKHVTKRPNRNHTLKRTKSKEGRKHALISLATRPGKAKHKNETLSLKQTNLFKSNRNEMKRLFVMLLVLIVVGEFLETPSAPLSDASLLEYLGESRIHYGKQRLWGSLGHGIASVLVGMLLERSRHLTCGEEFIDYTTSFSVFTVFMLITLVISANFAFRYKDVEETHNSVLSTVFTVHYISFLTAVCYMGMCQGLIHNFLMWFLEDLGGSKTLMGLSICSRNFADLIMFIIVSQVIELLGQIKIVFIALISYGTIFIAYSTMTNPWFALGVEFLGGLTFAASWTACTSYLAEAAPQESVTTMQGILQGVYWGLGMGTGSILGGHFIHTLGPQWTFRAAATGSFVIASLFAVTQWRWQREDLDDSVGIYEYFSSAEPKDTEALLKEDTSDRTLNNTKPKGYRKPETKRKSTQEKHEQKRNKRQN